LFLRLAEFTSSFFKHTIYLIREKKIENGGNMIFWQRKSGGWTAV